MATLSTTTRGDGLAVRVDERDRQLSRARWIAGGAGRLLARGAGRQLHGGHRAERLRQVDAAAADRRPAARRMAARSRSAAIRAGRPEPVTAGWASPSSSRASCHGCRRSTTWRCRWRCMATPPAERNARAHDALARVGLADAAELAAARAVRRHGAARRPGPGPDQRPAGAAAGRAVLGARRADPRGVRHRAPGALAGAAAHRDPGHALGAGGRAPGGSDRGHDRRGPDRSPAWSKSTCRDPGRSALAGDSRAVQLEAAVRDTLASVHPPELASWTAQHEEAGRGACCRWLPSWPPGSC